MKVGFSVQNYYPSDREVRTKKLAEYLSKEDIDVSVFCPNKISDWTRENIKNELGPPTEISGFETIHRCSWLSSTPIFQFLIYPVPFNLFLFIWYTFQFKKSNPDIVVASDLRISIPTILAAKIIGIPTIVDIRENYPAFAKHASKKANSKIVQKTLYNPTLVAYLEGATIALADKVWVVADVRKEELMDKGSPAEKISVVKNTPYIREKENHLGGKKCLGKTAQRDSKYTLLYLGMVEESRGIQNIIKALGHSNTKNDVELVIGGTGKYVDELKILAESLGIQNRIKFRGYIQESEVSEFYSEGDVGVIPHIPDAHWNNTIPNKLFDYMSHSLPVLATATPPVEAVIKSANCGCTIPNGSDDLQTSEVINQMRSAHDLEELGKNGKNAVVDRYNWTVDGQIAKRDLNELAIK